MQEKFQDVSLPISERIDDLLGRLTLQEKVGQMLHASPAIERLGILDYNWWNECLHGVARAGVATVFPQAIALAATWDIDLLARVANVISDEARAKHHEFDRKGDHGIYKGLTYWSPNINIFRDPRWGRGHETYGEDPYLTSRMGVTFVKGLQGNDPKYLKLVATPKHFAVHSGPESLRHGFDVNPSKKDLYETYLPAFKACVQEAGAASIMSAYNRVYGEACSASDLLLQQILRDEWGFKGYVVSDCGAIQDIHTHHKITSCAAESAAISVKNGCDLECGCAYASLITAVERGLITEEEIDTSLKRLLESRFRLGMFDPNDMVLYASIPYEVNDCPAHRELAREAAQKSIVLLKNEQNLLPLKRDLGSIAVIGPNADSYEVIIANYNGTPSQWVTPLQGIRNAVSDRTRVFFAEGCGLLDPPNEWNGTRTAGFAEAVAAAERSDVVIICLGLNARIEGEEGDAFNSDAAGDRTHISLTGSQEDLLKAVCAVGKPVVIVILNGSCLAINWAQENVPAIVEAWYPGEEGGNAIADIIFGNYNPSGRLPITFYKSMEDLPDFQDYSMRGRTYRYFDGEPLYPFGFGLSYTTFAYSDLNVTPNIISVGESLTISAKVKNTGEIAGDEVVELYISRLDAPVDVPTRQLAGFRRLHLKPCESQDVEFVLHPEQLGYVYEDGCTVIEPGRVGITLGGSQGDMVSSALGAAPVLRAEIEIY